MDMTENAAAQRLKSFPALSRDVFQSLYSLAPRKNDADMLTAAAQRFNAPILDHVAQQDDYPTLKNICEGRSLPAYEAAAEFTARVTALLVTVAPVRASMSSPTAASPAVPRNCSRKGTSV